MHSTCFVFKVEFLIWKALSGLPGLLVCHSEYEICYWGYRELMKSVFNSPASERSRLIGLANSGSIIGSIVGLPLGKGDLSWNERATDSTMAFLDSKRRLPGNTDQPGRRLASHLLLVCDRSIAKLALVESNHSRFPFKQDSVASVSCGSSFCSCWPPIHPQITGVSVPENATTSCRRPKSQLLDQWGTCFNGQE